MKVLELFSGYGSQSLALKRLGIDHKSDISEIDKYAIDVYNQIHGKTHNWGDITKIDEKELPYYDLITYSFPCQDISNAGKRRGLSKDSGTRSSLLWECERIIESVKPKYLLMENVKPLVGDVNLPNFSIWLKTLEDMGYRNYWQVLNAKDYGIPQNRERVFCVSILKELNTSYGFPKPIKLNKTLKYLLEDDVAESYYLKQEQVDAFMNSNSCSKEHSNTLCARDSYVVEAYKKFIDRNDYIPEMFNTCNCAEIKGVAPAQTTNCGSTGTSSTVLIQVGNLKQSDSFGGNPQTGRIYSGEGLAPCLNTMQGGGLEPKIVIGSTQKNTYIGNGTESPCLTAGMGQGGGNIPMVGFNNYKARIRKLTPRECWRLMGVYDSDFDKIKGVSNSQLYKMAGNSIVVDVLVEIFRNLLIDKVQAEQVSLFDIL